MIVYAISDAPKKKHVIASQSADWRGNPPDFPASTLVIVTFTHRRGGLPRRFAPRNDTVS